MAQHTSGWRLPLSLPAIYGFCMNLLGGPGPARKLVQTYIRPEKGMRILDLGCGPAVILDNLPESISYVGVDLSPAYIEAARKKYGKRAIFHCLPLETLEDSLFSGFDLVMGIGVLHHLDDRRARSFFSVAAKTLNGNGRCLTLDPCLALGQHPVARLLIRMDRGRNVRYSNQYAALAKSAFSGVDQWIIHDWMRIPYTHHIMECRR